MRRWVALLACLVLTAAVAGCSRPAPPVPRLVIAGGAPGEVSLALAEGLADAARAEWSIPVEVRQTSGSTDNLELIADGRADVAFATVDAALAARDGEKPFNGTVGLAALAGLYDDYLHLIVRADSGLHSLADLSGRPVAAGPPGSAAGALVDRLGLTPLPHDESRSIAPAAAAEALTAGTIDGLAVTGGLPMPLVTDLEARVAIRLIPLGAEVAVLQARYGERYLARTVPATMYGLATETPTVGIRAVLVVRANLPESTAFALTRLLFRAKDRLIARHAEARRLDPRQALDTGALPLHPGAARYFRETKPMV